MKWIVFPYRMYQVYYLEHVMQHIVSLFETNQLHKIKYLTNESTKSIVISFYNKQVKIKLTEDSFYYKDSEGQDVFEKEVWMNDLDINAFLQKIFKNPQVIEYVKKIKKEFYLENDEDSKIFKISDQDFVRNNPVDQYYTKQYKDKIFELCENKCFFCNNKDSLQVDHFFIPKSKGGNFILKTQSGFYINNAIILCEGCNKSKNDRSYKLFSAMIDYQKLAEIQLYMNKKINEIDMI